jgi:hypothetical protein
VIVPYSVVIAVIAAIVLYCYWYCYSAVIVLYSVEILLTYLTATSYVHRVDFLLWTSCGVLLVEFVASP